MTIISVFSSFLKKNSIIINHVDSMISTPLKEVNGSKYVKGGMLLFKIDNIPKLKKALLSLDYDYYCSKEKKVFHVYTEYVCKLESQCTNSKLMVLTKQYYNYVSYCLDIIKNKTKNQDQFINFKSIMSEETDFTNESMEKISLVTSLTEIL